MADGRWQMGDGRLGGAVRGGRPWRTATIGGGQGVAGEAIGFRSRAGRVGGARNRNGAGDGQRFSFEPFGSLLVFHSSSGSCKLKAT